MKIISKILREGEAQMFKKLNVLLILSTFLVLPVNAKFVQLECLSGDCSQVLNVDDLDLNKVLSNTVDSSLGLALDPKSLLVNNNYTNSFKVIVYEVDGAGNKKIFASSDVSLPNNARRLKTLSFSVKVEPFLGQKELHFAVHKADGTLVAIYQGLYNFTGTVTETNSGFSPNNTDNVGAKDESPRVVCTSENFNECNLDSLFFNRIQFEVDQKRQSQNVSIRKSPDGIYKISLPTISSNAVGSQAASGAGATTGTGTTEPTNNAANNIWEFKQIKLNDSALANQMTDGVFEFSNGALYFTSKGLRQRVVLNSDSSEIVKGSEVSAALLNDTKDTLFKVSGGHNVILKTTGSGTVVLPEKGRLVTTEELTPVFDRLGKLNDGENGLATRLTSVTSSIAALGTDLSSTQAGLTTANTEILGIKTTLGTLATLQTSLTTLTDKVNLGESTKLLNGTTGNGLVLAGGHNIILNTTADTNLTFPSSGTLATLADLAQVTTSPASSVPNNSVDGSKIVDKSITDNDISDTANITGSKIRVASIPLDRLGNNSVDGSKIVDKSITDNDISDTANITGSKIRPGSITQDRLAFSIASAGISANSVNTTHLVDKSVTEAKLADASVTDVKVAAIDAAKIKTGTLDVARIPALGIDQITGLQEKLDSLSPVSSKQPNDNLAKVINVTTDYVLTGEESGYILEVNSESDLTVIVPAGLQQGFQVEIVNITGVNVSFKAEENLLSYEGRTQLSGALSNAKLRNRGDKQWVLTGDLLASLGNNSKKIK